MVNTDHAFFISSLMWIIIGSGLYQDLDYARYFTVGVKKDTSMMLFKHVDMTYLWRAY